MERQKVQAVKDKDTGEKDEMQRRKESTGEFRSSQSEERIKAMREVEQESERK